jgi:hypothetical protein
MAEAVRCPLVTVWAWIRSQANPCGIYIGQTGSESDFSLCSGYYTVSISVMLYSRLLIYQRRYLIVALDNVVKQKTSSPTPSVTVFDRINSTQNLWL